MFKLILIAGGALALATAPAHAGGKPSLTQQVLRCLGCPGLGAPSAPGGAIVAGNLNASANANVGGAGVSSAATLNLNAAARLGTKGKTAASVLAKARLNANARVRSGGADCK